MVWLNRRHIRKIKEKLMIYDKTDITMTWKAKAFLNKSPAKHAIEGVSNFNEVLIALSEYIWLKWVIFNTHGCPGGVALPKGGFTRKDVGLLRGTAKILQKDARIFFSGCNIGEGIVGRNFLKSVGENMLPGKGGAVGASNSMTFDFFGDATYRLWGKVRILYFDTAGRLLKEREV